MDAVESFNLKYASCRDPIHEGDSTDEGEEACVGAVFGSWGYGGVARKENM